MKAIALLLPLLILSFLLPTSCEEFLTDDEDDDGGIQRDSEYVVFAWNDRGMHFLNPTYDESVILPPYNTLRAQVVKRANPPEIVTEGITVEYSIINNTQSYSKRSYGQFWDNSQSLFGIELDQNKGLNFKNPDRNNGLSGEMIAGEDHFETNGIPVVPVDDDGNWDPYQVAEITVKDSDGNLLIATQTTVPASDEINCAKCHGSDPWADILVDHDDIHGTNLQNQTPVLCADCHASPLLDVTTSGTNYLSRVIHDSHSERGAECYDCHPGETTKFSRSMPHTTTDGNCESCHGSMTQVASSIESDGRVPWVNEPKCSQCHENIHEVDTGTALYQNATGHGGMFCASCHGSPHAMVPSRIESDNYQAIQYQDKAVSIGSCAACHSNAKGPGETDEFAEEHGGSNFENETACHICHTAVSSNRSQWPHAFQW